VTALSYGDGREACNAARRRPRQRLESDQRRPALSPPDRRQRFDGGGELQPKRWRLQQGVGIGPASAGEARPFQPE
jgi:hypothetical protein